MAPLRCHTAVGEETFRPFLRASRGGKIRQNSSSYSSYKRCLPIAMFFVLWPLFSFTTMSRIQQKGSSWPSATQQFVRKEQNIQQQISTAALPCASYRNSSGVAYFVLGAHGKAYEDRIEAIVAVARTFDNRTASLPRALLTNTNASSRVRAAFDCVISLEDGLVPDIDPAVAKVTGVGSETWKMAWHLSWHGTYLHPLFE